MKPFQFNPDEHPATSEKIMTAEMLWKSKLPEDYKRFLMEHNGGQIYPNIPAIQTDTSDELWAIQRMVSIDDIILQKKYAMGYTWNRQHEEEVLDKYNVSTEYLMTFAVAERGVYYINLREDQYGQIYYACYQDGAGLVRVETNSFEEFMDSLQPYEGREFPGFNTRSTKIYDEYYFYTDQQPALGLQRFKEVLSFLGDANSKAHDGAWTVIQHYAYAFEHDKMNECIFNELLANGGSIEGLLNRTRNIDRVRKLITEYGADINKPYNGRYPIILYTANSSWSGVKENYNLLHGLLQMDIPIDFQVKNSQGETAIQQLRNLIVEYEKYREYDKKFWASKPQMHKFITSDPINKLLKTQAE